MRDGLRPLLVLSLLSPLLMGAAPPARVIVLAVGQPSSQSTDLVWAARTAVADQEGLTSVDVTAALDSGGDAPADLEAARALLGEGRALYESLEVEAAVEKLERAALWLLAYDAPREAGDALVELARAQLAAKQKAAARRAFQLALRLGARIEREALRPSAARALSEAERASGRGKATLRVESFPVPSTIRVDGRPVGVTPALLPDIAAGPHAIVLEADGFERDLRLITLRPRGAAFTAELRPARRAALFDGAMSRLPEQIGRSRVEAPLRDLKSIFFADQAVLLELRERKVVAHLYDLRASSRVRLVEGPATPPAEAGARIIRALYRGLDPRSPGLIAPEVAEPEPIGEPYHTRWWFWPAVGGAVVAAAAIPLALLLGGEDEEGLKRRDDSGAVIISF